MDSSSQLIKKTDLTLTMDNERNIGKKFQNIYADKINIGGVNVNKLIQNIGVNNNSKDKLRSKKTKKNRKLLLTKIRNHKD